MALSRYPYLLAVLSALFLATAPLARPALAEVTPVEQVETVDTALLDAMKQADQIGFEGRYELLKPVLQQAFDFAYMAEVAVGRHWQKLDERQKQTLVEAFSDMSIATFASRFSGYSGEKFEVGEARPGPRGTQLVPNKIIKADGEGVPFNFILRQAESGSWQIVDVLLDAKYSELATRRSEYTSVVDRQGFEALIDILERKVAQLGAAG